jgi:hypothetical protein
MPSDTAVLFVRVPADLRNRVEAVRGDADLSWWLREVLLDKIGRDGLTPNYTHGEGGGSPAHKKRSVKKAVLKKLPKKRK